MMKVVEKIAKAKGVWVALGFIVAIFSAGAAGRELVERPRNNQARIDSVEHTLDSMLRSEGFTHIELKEKLNRIATLAEIQLCKMVVEERGEERWQTQCVFPGQRARIVNEYMNP